MTSSNIDTFLKEAPAVPKVILFTDKTGIPTIFKGLSLNFEVNYTYYKELLFKILKLYLFYSKNYYSELLEVLKKIC